MEKSIVTSLESRLYLESCSSVPEKVQARSVKLTILTLIGANNIDTKQFIRALFKKK